MRGQIGKKWLRYVRWSIKATCLPLFLVPVAYLAKGQLLFVSSFFYAEPIDNIAGFTVVRSFFKVPITQAPASIWLSYYGNVSPGLWLVEPFGGLQVLLTGQVGAYRLMPLIIAIIIFLIPIVLLGNVFCSWFCPIGTIIDSFDRFIEVFLPRIDVKRKKRTLNKHVKKESSKNYPACRFCPFLKGTGFMANGLLISSLVGSAILKFPVFCAICPIGIATRAMFHFKAMMAITGTWMVWWLEMFTVPIITTLLSLKEKRYWCKRLCPVGSFLGTVGIFNPFIKPRVIWEKKCPVRGCRKCEEVCPVDISLVEHDSLAQCTKCLECYIVCDYDAIKLDLLVRPDIFQSINNLYNRIRKRLTPR